jgi:hypothetical protein
LKAFHERNVEIDIEHFRRSKNLRSNIKAERCRIIFGQGAYPVNEGKQGAVDLPLFNDGNIQKI